MKDWVSVDTTNVSPEVEIEIRGAKVSVALSPYEVPMAVRGYHEKKSDFFVIEFKYPMSEEVLSKEILNDHLTLEIGEKSGRIFRIKINVVDLKCKSVDLKFLQENAMGRIDSALDNLKSRPPYNILPQRYDVTSKVIHQNRNRVFEEA